MQPTDLRFAAGWALLGHAAILIGGTLWSAGPIPVQAAVDDAAPLEVRMLSPEQVTAILDPSPMPAAPRLREAASVESAVDLANPTAQAEVQPPLLARIPDATVAEPSKIALPTETTLTPLDRLTPLTASEPAPQKASEPTEQATPAPPSPTMPGATQATESATNTLPTLSTHVVILRRPPLVYPTSARRAGIEGQTELGLEIDAEGSVSRTWILKSSGSQVLDQSALDNVRRWRFDVKTLKTDRTFRQSITFTLRGTRAR